MAIARRSIAGWGAVSTGDNNVPVNPVFFENATEIIDPTFITEYPARFAENTTVMYTAGFFNLADTDTSARAVNTPTHTDIAAAPADNNIGYAYAFS
jgi:hypothetical protein